MDVQYSAALRSTRSTPDLRHDRKRNILKVSASDLSQLPVAKKHEIYIHETEIVPDFEDQLEKLELETPIEDNQLTDIKTDEDLRPKTQARFKSAIGAAFDDAKHFAGGLISHPSESTKHYSILRHSFGIIYYHGPTTSVTITIFSDRPLPPDRKLWLQRRGYSGKTGLTVGAALGTNTSSWIDVTPVSMGTVDTVDERAWQRDISKWQRKAKEVRNLKKQVPRETDVVRIPLIAEDGYFRIVLCSGRKVLCPSPVFRCASTSLDPAVLRGASLRTLPLELGVKVGAVVARKAANVAAQRTVGPAIVVAERVAKPLVAGGVGNDVFEKTMNKAPVHWLGIRSESMTLKDELIGNGGICIRR